MYDLRAYRCFFLDETGRIVGFDAHDFSDDAQAIEWADHLKVPPEARSIELRLEERVVHRRPAQQVRA